MSSQRNRPTSTEWRNFVVIFELVQAAVAIAFIGIWLFVGQILVRE